MRILCNICYAYIFCCIIIAGTKSLPTYSTQVMLEVMSDGVKVQTKGLWLTLFFFVYLL